MTKIAFLALLLVFSCGAATTLRHLSEEELPLQRKLQLKLQNQPESQSKQNPQNDLITQRENIGSEKNKTKEDEQLNKQLEKYYCRRKRVHRSNLNSSGKERSQLVETIYGFNMYVDPIDRMVSKSIAQIGTWEPQYINLIGHIVKPGMNVLNLGSQSGLEAIIMGKLIGNQGKLFIFEPYSISNALITKNVQLNNLTQRTTIYKYGASNKKSTATLTIQYRNTGGSQIRSSQSYGNSTEQIERRQKKLLKQFNQVEDVELEQVDNLLPSDVVLDFALIDVEKMEVQALEGMRKIIERSRERLVLMVQWQFGRHMPTNRGEYQERAIAILKFLVDLGYRIYTYEGSATSSCTVGLFTKMVSYNEALRIGYRDIFFFPKNIDPPGRTIASKP